jgi:putative membrane protein
LVSAIEGALVVTDLTDGGATEAHSLAVDRTHLAYERTMLSWVRTATALITFGFSIQQFFRIAKGESPEKAAFIGPHEFGLAMIVIGLVGLLLAALGHRSAIQALKRQYPVTAQYPGIPRSPAGVLAALVAILGLLALLSMLLHQ